MRFARFFLLVVTLSVCSVFIGSAQSVENDYSCEDQIDQVILYARLKLGCPYEWGGSGPRTYDCSGLVNYAFQ